MPMCWCSPSSKPASSAMKSKHSSPMLDTHTSSITPRNRTVSAAQWHRECHLRRPPSQCPHPSTHGGPSVPPSVGSPSLASISRCVSPSGRIGTGSSKTPECCATAPSCWPVTSTQERHLSTRWAIHSTARASSSHWNLSVMSTLGAMETATTGTTRGTAPLATDLDWTTYGHLQR